MKPSSRPLSRRAAIAALASVLDAYDSALTSAIYDEDNREKVPQEERDLVARAEAALTMLRKPISVKPPKVIVHLSSKGLLTVYASNKAIPVEIVDDCCCDEIEQAEANDTYKAAIAAAVKAGTLFEVA